MFNTTIVNESETEYVPYVKEVHHHKAPTDESIRLLNEFKEKALKETMYVFKTKDCPIEAVFRYCESPATMRRYCAVTFTINGERHDYVLDLEDGRHLTTAGSVEILKKKYRELVETVVLDVTAKTVFKSFLDSTTPYKLPQSK